MQENNQVSQKITQELLGEIREGRFKNATALPPEVQLAEEFKVSRNAVREALARLEREGWIARKHGVGTLINRHVIDAGTRLDLNYEFKKTLEISGHEVKIKNFEPRRVSACSEMAAKLNIPVGDELLRVSRLFMADDKPAIYCVDYFPVRLLITETVTKDQYKNSFFEFMQKHCNISVESSLAEIRARQVTEEAAQALNVSESTVLLTMEEVSYDLHSRSVLFSEAFFIDRMIHHTIVRKKI
jgi:GntR family transcriptional regulator